MAPLAYKVISKPPDPVPAPAPVAPEPVKKVENYESDVYFTGDLYYIDDRPCIPMLLFIFAIFVLAFREGFE